MLERIFIAKPGTSDWDDKATKHKDYMNLNGLWDTSRIGLDILATGHPPKAIYIDEHLGSAQTAFVLGGMFKTWEIIEEPGLREGVFSAHPRGREKHPFRETFRTPEAIHTLLSKKKPLAKDVTDVMFITDFGWATVLGGSWPCSSVYVFNINTQELKFLAYHGLSI